MDRNIFKLVAIKGNPMHNAVNFEGFPAFVASEHTSSALNHMLGTTSRGSTGRDATHKGNYHLIHLNCP